MFKGNISPLNTNKDNKYSHHNIQNNHNESYGHGMGNGNPITPGGYQYSKFTYPVNLNGQGTANNGNPGKYQIGSNLGNNYNNAPISPNINKAPMSPTAKIKMFSNTLVANKKNVSSTNQLLYPQNTQDNTHIPTKQHHTNKLIPNNNSSKLLINNNKQHQQTFNLTDSIDLKCDQVLQQSEISTMNHYSNSRSPLQNIHKKQAAYNNNNIKKTKSNIPILKLQPDIQDDLKCDQVLDMVNRQNDNQSSRRNINIKGNSNQNNNGNFVHGNNDENNFTYVNQMIGNKENRYNGQNDFKMNGNEKYCPLTPNHQKKKFSQIPLILTKKNTSQRQVQPQPKNSSIKNLLQQKPNNQQKIRSLSTNIIHLQSNPPAHHQNLRYQQNNEQSSEQKSLDLSQRPLNLNKVQKNIQQLTQNFKQRTQKVLEQYRKKLQQAEQKIKLLEKENGQLKKCMNGGNIGHESTNQQTVKRENLNNNNMKNYSHFNHPIHGLISGGNGNIMNGKNINGIIGMK